MDREGVVASNIDRLRVATALAVLKFKPPDQSVTSFVLHLRSIIPPSSVDGKETHGITKEAASWKQRALRLEEDYAALQAKYEAEQVRNLTLVNEAAATPPSTNPEFANTVSDKASKKKTKKRPVNAMADDQCSKCAAQDHPFAGFKNIREGTQFLTADEQDTMFAALDSLFKLLQLPKQVLAGQGLLLSTTTIRVIECAGSILDQIVSSSTRKLPADNERLEGLQTILYQVLTTALPILTKRTQARSGDIPNQDGDKPLDLVIHKLVSRVFHPLMQSFMALSLSFADTLQSPLKIPSTNSSASITASSKGERADQRQQLPPAHLTAMVDVRPKVLGLFRTIFYVVDEQVKPCRLIGSCLAAEGVRVLETVWKPVPCQCDLERPGGIAKAGGNLTGEGDNAPRIDEYGGNRVKMGRSLDEEALGHTAGIRDRVRRLAQKDATWYLCAALYCMCPDFAPDRSPEEKNIGPMNERIAGRLRQAVLDGLLRLVSNQAMIGSQAGPILDEAPKSREGVSHQEGRGSSEVWKGHRAAEIRGYEQGRTLEQIGSLSEVGDGRDRCCDIRPNSNGTATDGGKQSLGASRVVGMCEEFIDVVSHARGTCAGRGDGVGSTAAGDVGGPLASVKTDVERHPVREMTRWDGVCVDQACRCQERNGTQIEWDEQARAMVLGVVERYWHWSLESDGGET